MDPLSEISRTLEDYLEVIARLIGEKGVARVRDIAHALSVHKSTVSSALKSLSAKGLVEHNPYEAATLTARGQQVADEVARRHQVISRFLEEVLLIDEDMAQANACRMEHVLDKQVMERLRLFASFVKECPRTGQDWLGRFRYYFQHGGQRPSDGSAVKQWLDNFKEDLELEKKGS